MVVCCHCLFLWYFQFILRVFYQADLTLKYNLCTDAVSGNESAKTTFNL